MDVLKTEAELQGISPNALVNKILREYCLFGCMPFPTVILSQETFSQIIASCSKEELKAMARKAGVKILSDIFNSVGLELNRENIIGYIKEGLSQYSNWFTYSHRINKQGEMLHLRHYLGENWSFYVSEVMQTVFESHLHIKPRIETSGHTIMIQIPRNEHV